MNRALMRMLDAAEGRALSDLESEQLMGYAEGLMARLDMHRTIEQAENAILTDVYETMMKQYPEIEREHGPTGPDKMKRDLGLVLRYAVLAMVMRDADFIHDKLAVWFRTIMFALSNPQRVTASLVAVEQACTRHLSAATARELLPYLRVVSDEFRQALGQEATSRAA